MNPVVMKTLTEFNSGPVTRLNKLKTKQFAEMRNFSSSNTTTAANPLKCDSKPIVPSFDRIANLNKNTLKSNGRTDTDDKINPTENDDTGVSNRLKEMEDERFNRDLAALKNKWEKTDIRSVSPPWSNGRNTLSDFNLTSQPESAAPSVAPVEQTEINQTLVDTDPVWADKASDSFTEAERTINEEMNAKPKSLDLTVALGGVSLGVNSLEVLDKRNSASLYEKNWSAKFRSPLQKVIEEQDYSDNYCKENVPPKDTEDSFEDSENSSQNDGEQTFKNQPDFPPDNGVSEKLKNLQAQLKDLTSRIDIAEEKRIQAENERSQLEFERKRVFSELFDLMDNTQMIVKRSKSSTVKKKPSYAAALFNKSEFKSPKGDSSAFMRTPSRKSNSRLLSTSILNPYTPKTLQKNMNKQFNSIFGSES